MATRRQISDAINGAADKHNVACRTCPHRDGLMLSKNPITSQTTAEHVALRVQCKAVGGRIVKPFQGNFVDCTRPARKAAGQARKRERLVSSSAS